MLEKEGSSNARPFGKTKKSEWDIMTPYLVDRTNIIETPKGNWLISGDYGNCFLNNDDSLFVFNPYYPVYPDIAPAERLKAIIGKVGNRFLSVFPESDRSHGYYLTDLENSPAIDSAKTEKVYFSDLNPHYYTPADADAVIAVRHISGDLYAVNKFRRAGIYIYRLSGNVFNFVKTTLTNVFRIPTFQRNQWECRNGRFYLILSNGVTCFYFDPADSTFRNGKKLFFPLNMGGNSVNPPYGIDKDFRYIAAVHRYPGLKNQDTLKIFDIDKEKLINSVFLGSSNEPDGPVIDSPYVYLHQITKQVTLTGVEEENRESVSDYSLRVNPNPFNPVTNIRYTIPSGAEVKLFVYNLLGAEVEQLTSGFKPAGTYNIEFNAASLTSGVYLCILQAGEIRISHKLLLIK